MKATGSTKATPLERMARTREGQESPSAQTTSIHAYAYCVANSGLPITNLVTLGQMYAIFGGGWRAEGAPRSAMGRVGRGSKSRSRVTITSGNDGSLRGSGTPSSHRLWLVSLSIHSHTREDGEASRSGPMNALSKRGRSNPELNTGQTR